MTVTTNQPTPKVGAYQYWRGQLAMELSYKEENLPNLGLTNARIPDQHKNIRIKQAACGGYNGALHYSNYRSHPELPTYPLISPTPYY